VVWRGPVRAIDLCLRQMSPEARKSELEEGPELHKIGADQVELKELPDFRFPRIRVAHGNCQALQNQLLKSDCWA